MGILKDTKAQETPGHTKRKSIHDDLANLGPIKPGGAAGFLNFRDTEPKVRKGKKNDDEMDSDDDDTDNPILGKADDEEATDKTDDHLLSPDDIQRQGELAESMRKIRVSLELSLSLAPADNVIAQAPTLCRTPWRQRWRFCRHPSFRFRVDPSGH